MRVPAAVLLALLLCSLAAAAPQSLPVNLAFNRPFTCNSAVLPGWHGLVDGEKDSDTAPGCFATANDPELPKWVVIDLGGECSVSKVVVYNSANGNTRTISLASSVDLINFKKLRDPDFIFGDHDATVLSHAFQPRTARYIRITLPDTWKKGLGGDYCLFLREVEVYGSRTGESEDSPFAFAAQQAPVDRNRSVDIFKRYCLGTLGEMKITIVGDYTIAGADADSHWAAVLVSELLKLYPDKKITLTAVGGDQGAISNGLDWAREHRGVLAPDLILLSYGAQAASVGADVSEFRSKYQALVAELTENTQALVVAVTPPPFLQNPNLPLLDRSRGRTTRSYGWAVEQVALGGGLPLARTASVLANAPGGAVPLYLDNLHLGPEGQRALGLALADLLR